MQEIILYQTEDGQSQIQLRAENETVWLSQLEMAELFAATKQNISLHLKNIFDDGELNCISVVKESLTTAADGKDYQTKLYNLDAILAVGYRVRSPRGVQFRRWASTVLKEYLIKGFAMDDERLKKPDGRPDHFDEMLRARPFTYIFVFKEKTPPFSSAPCRFIHRDGSDWFSQLCRTLRLRPQSDSSPVLIFDIIF